MLTFFRNSAIRRAFSTFFNIDHEWIKYNPKTKVGVVGITDYAHSQLGDIIFVQMPDVGTKFKQGDVLGKLESTRVVDDIYCPLSGEVVEVNKKILEAPDLINNDPNDEGWLVKIKIENLGELDNLYDKPDYDKLVQQLKRKHSI
jgi:glycine cleavage system H protein